jgi:hypothetical protein
MPFLEKQAQNGRGIKRPAQRPSDLLCCLAARIRALCALYPLRRFATFGTLLLLTSTVLTPADLEFGPENQFPCPEKLSYKVEWRMMTAGSAIVQLTRGKPNHWNFDLHIESTGLVLRLYRVLDTYKVESTDQFCGSTSTLDAQEGKRHIITRMNFQTGHKLEVEERDAIRNLEQKREFEIPPCTYEIAGALAELRASNLQPGKSITLPISNGKKLAYGKIEAQTKENLTIDGKAHSTIRYEAFLFDNVLYKRKGRLFIWMTDDPERLPVQFRFQMGFPLGSITIQLDKRERL